MLLKEVCVLDVASCGRDASILEAARLMRQHHTGDLIVVDDPGGDRVPLGIVTDRDIVVEVLANELDPAKTTVAEIMSARLVIAGADEDISVAIERMRLHGVRRLPVVDDAGCLIGDRHSGRRAQAARGAGRGAWPTSCRRNRAGSTARGASDHEEY